MDGKGFKHQKITHQFPKNLVPQSLIADVQKRSNLEPAFTENFCRYTLWALRFQPKVCLYDPADDVHVSGMIIGSGHWEYTGTYNVYLFFQLHLY